jgi:hypothetical protein
MQNRKSFTVKSSADFDAFLTELDSALVKAVPDVNARKIISTGLESLIRLTRFYLALQLPPTTYYLVDEDDRLAWEETDQIAGKVIVFEMNKSWAQR